MELTSATGIVALQVLVQLHERVRADAHLPAGLHPANLLFRR
jgi:hypothetical protein